MKTPLVSIILSASVTAKALRAFHIALQRQSCIDWELLVACDTDSPEERPSDSRIRYLDLPTFASPSVVRNRALSEARGTFVAFLSANDTYCSEQTLEILTLIAESRQAKACAGTLQVHRGNEYPRIITFAKDGIVRTEEEPFEIGLAAFLFRRAWLCEQALHFASNDPAEDCVFLTEALWLADWFIARAEICVYRSADPASSLTAYDKALETVEDFGKLLAFATKQQSETLYTRQTEKLLKVHRSELRRQLSAAHPEGKKILSDRLHALSALLTPEDRVRLDETYLQPLVSVIVPVYNAAAYLGRCLASLQAQTLPNIEVICVNDGSTDCSLELLENAKSEMPNLVILSQENAGQGAARNAAMRVAHGKYLGFVDADDWVEPGMFEAMANALETFPEADIAKCGTLCAWDYEETPQAKEGLLKYFQEDRPEGCHRISAEDLTTGGPWDKLFRRSLIETNGIRFPEGVKNEDEAFCFFALCRATHYVCLHTTYYHYIKNASGTMAVQERTANQNAKLPDTFAIFNLMLDFLSKEDRIPMYGRIIKSIVGASCRFENTPLREKVQEISAFLLTKAHVHRYSDFILPKYKAWCLQRIPELLNHIPEEPPELQDLTQYLPHAQCSSNKQHENVSSSSPDVTFIVPVYNVEGYLSRCLESLRAQTLETIEILCIDDGSLDESPLILDEYRVRDSRIRVIHKENTGVSDTRNLGIREARGKYIAFVDGDDWMAASMAKETFLIAEHTRLEMCHFDYECFDYKTEKKLDHYWTLTHHLSALSHGVFTFGECKNLEINAGACQWLWSRDFLLKHNLQFPSLKLGEDFVFVMQALSKLRRGYVIHKPYYHYRKGNPTSAVSRLSRSSHADSSNAKIELLKAFAPIYRKILSKCAAHPDVLRAFLRRVCQEIFYYAESSSIVHAWFFEKSQQEYLAHIFSSELLGESLYNRYLKLMQTPPKGKIQTRFEALLQAAPSKIQRMLSLLAEQRQSTTQDCYVVVGQLNSTTNEPIDSWTFFRWLQQHHIPSIYVLWRKHPFYQEICRTNKNKDVIALSSDGVSTYEFLERCYPYLVRAKALIMENAALHPLLWRWISREHNFPYVFLQHGVFYWKMSELLGQVNAQFNFINVASPREKTFLTNHTPPQEETSSCPKYLVAGLPRWDLLHDESHQISTEKIVFIMFTWRATFNAGDRAFAKSRYYSRIKSLVTAKNLLALKQKGVRLVLAQHHHLASRLREFDFGHLVEIAKPSQISFWIRRASLCVTDYSSVSFDFLFLGKPVIYWLLDKGDLLLNQNDQEELAFAERQAQGMFNVVSNTGALVELIEYYANNGFVLEPEKRAIADTFFRYRENISQHLYEELERVTSQNLDVVEPAVEAQNQEGGEK